MQNAFSRRHDGAWRRLRAAARVRGWSILRKSLDPAQIIQSSAIYRSQLPDPCFSWGLFLINLGVLIDEKRADES